MAQEANPTENQAKEKIFCVGKKELGGQGFLPELFLTEVVRINGDVAGDNVDEAAKRAAASVVIVVDNMAARIFGSSFYRLVLTCYELGFRIRIDGKKKEVLACLADMFEIYAHLKPVSAGFLVDDLGKSALFIE